MLMTWLMVGALCELRREEKAILNSTTRRNWRGWTWHMRVCAKSRDIGIVSFPWFGRSSSMAAFSRLGVHLRYLFEDCVLDTDEREVRRGIDAAPQVLNLLAYLIHNRVVSKGHLIAAIWGGMR